MVGSVIFAGSKSVRLVSIYQNLSSLTRIAEQLALSSQFKNEEQEFSPIPPTFDNYETRPVYKQGEFSNEVDFKVYTDLMKGEEANG